MVVLVIAEVGSIMEGLTVTGESVDQMAPGEFREDLVAALTDAVFRGLEAELAFAGTFKSTVHPGHAFHQTGRGFGIEAFDVTALALGEGALYPHDEETILRDDRGDKVAEIASRSDEGDDGSEARLHGELGHIGGAADVFGAVFGGEAEV